MAKLTRRTLLTIAPAAYSHAAAPAAPRRFQFDSTRFLLDGRPFTMISGEMQPARIPHQYWTHRIRMAKAMGCNTIACYVFWSFHEPAEARFDFTSPERDIARFLHACAAEGLPVILRPGPYCCAEWDFGALPPYLLRIPDIKIRCLDPRYMAAAGRYLRALARVIKPLMWHQGGPVLMVQIENEYGSYGNDRAYLERLRQIWIDEGVQGPFFTADGPTPALLEAGSLPTAAVGLDGAPTAEGFDLAHKMRPGVPVLASEVYPGWLTHWGEPWARVKTEKLLGQVRFLLDNHHSFNLYLVHGGTSFDFIAGANSGGKGYQPDVTSYDYDSPINEQGRPTPKYHALRSLFATPATPAIPEPIPAMSVSPITLRPHASLWDNLGAPLASIQPRPMEEYGQYQGLIVYEAALIGPKSGKLVLTHLHDYATIFVDDAYIGTLDRRQAQSTLELPPPATATPRLTILVEAMGRINFGPQMIDRKGITDHVTLNNTTLMNWRVYRLPLECDWVEALKPAPAGHRPGVFFRGEFHLATAADTFLDLSHWTKGIVWVNGRNLGRYWNIGPQQRLFCPGVWLRQGSNRITVFDVHQTEPAPIAGFPEMNV